MAYILRLTPHGVEKVYVILALRLLMILRVFGVFKVDVAAWIHSIIQSSCPFDGLPGSVDSLTGTEHEPLSLCDHDSVGAQVGGLLAQCIDLNPK
jgi:hypothetical protein